MNLKDLIEENQKLKEINTYLTNRNESLKDEKVAYRDLVCAILSANSGKITVYDKDLLMAKTQQIISTEDVYNRCLYLELINDRN